MERIRYQLPFDVSRCSNRDCAKSEECARFKDIPHFAPWLPYGQDLSGGKEDCEFFIKYLLDTNNP